MTSSCNLVEDVICSNYILGSLLPSLSMVVWDSEEQRFSVMDCYGKLTVLESNLSDKERLSHNCFLDHHPREGFPALKTCFSGSKMMFCAILFHSRFSSANLFYLNAKLPKTEAINN